MKWLLLLIVIMPTELMSQKKNNGFAYVAAGIWTGKENTNTLFPSAGVGFKTGKVSLGAAAYYSKKYKLSMNVDLRMYLSKNNKPGPYIFIQPGIALFRENFGAVSSKGGFDFKGGIGFMAPKTPGVYFSVGYNSFRVSTTGAGLYQYYVMKGAFALIGVKL